MANDGSTYGITAEQALGGVLGGDDIPEEAKQTRLAITSTPRMRGLG